MFHFTSHNQSLTELKLYPDYDNIIINNVNIPVNTVHTVKTKLYTATEDCYIQFSHNNGNVNAAKTDTIVFYINNSDFCIFSFYGWMKHNISPLYFLKKGDTVSFINDLISIALYSVIGVK